MQARDPGGARGGHVHLEGAQFRIDGDVRRPPPQVGDNPKRQGPVAGEGNRTAQGQMLAVGLLEGAHVRRIDRQRHGALEHIRDAEVEGKAVVRRLHEIGIDAGLCVESLGEILGSTGLGVRESGEEVLELRGRIEDIGQVVADQRQLLPQVVGRRLQTLYQNGDVIEAGCDTCRRNGIRVTREQEAGLQRFQPERMSILLSHRSPNEGRTHNSGACCLFRYLVGLRKLRSRSADARDATHANPEPIRGRAATWSRSRGLILLAMAAPTIRPA